MMTIYTLVVVLLLFGMTIFVHELGHFLAARWAGMVVEVFSIGFGPAIWKRKIGEVTYKIGAFPLGGYVALPQMDPADRRGEKDAAEKPLPRVAPWKKIIVALAGATGNMILAVFLAYLVFWIGKPSSPSEQSCAIGFVDTNSVAYAEGLRIGDRILSVDGEPVKNWNEFAIRLSLLKNCRLEVESGGATRTVDLPTERNEIGVLSLDGVWPVNFCDVGGVVPGSSAEKAGIKAGDRIVEFNNVSLFSREQLIDLVNQARDATVGAVVLRRGARVDVLVTPEYSEEVGRALIGVQFSMMDIDYDQISHPSPGSQIRSHATAIIRILKALVTPKKARAAAQGIGGPIMILAFFWWAVSQSIMIAIWFTCFINVNLAILNLLPIPILDGGHIVFSLWEWITRRPVHTRVVNMLSNIFFFLFIAVFVFLTYRDAARLGFSRFFKRAPAAERVEEPEPAPAEQP